MDDTVTVNGNSYIIERLENEIHLKRYNQKHKMWVSLYFPCSKSTDNEAIIEALSKLFIERNV